MKLREALELLKKFDQDHEVNFVTPADPGDGPPRLMLVSARAWLATPEPLVWCGHPDHPGQRHYRAPECISPRLARATQSHVPPSNVPPGHTTTKETANEPRHDVR